MRREAGCRRLGRSGQQCCLFETPSRPAASPMSSVIAPIAIGNEPPPLGGMWAPPPAAACCRSLLPPWLSRRCPAAESVHYLQEPNAESRAAVQSGKLVLPSGPVVLDPEPDIREVRGQPNRCFLQLVLPLLSGVAELDCPVAWRLVLQTRLVLFAAARTAWLPLAHCCCGHASCFLCACAETCPFLMPYRRCSCRTR